MPSSFDGLRAMRAQYSTDSQGHDPKSNVDRYVVSNTNLVVLGAYSPTKDPLRVLAIDQTIGNSGWVYTIDGADGLTIVDSGTVKTEADRQSGWKSTLDRALLAAEAIESMLDDHMPFDIVVFEAPVAKGFRTESSAIMAYAIRHVVENHFGQLTAMISPQTGKRILTGYSNAKKPLVKQALAEQPWILGTVHNEHERDALVLDIAYRAALVKGSK
jgi:Holliday junction resolvasome RuvABC endonuclease subunit